MTDERKEPLLSPVYGEPDKVAPQYRVWIDEHYPTSDKAVAMCGGATAKMIEAFPELRRVRGYYQGRPHWWCATSNGTIVDPTVIQFHDDGRGAYEALDETKPLPTGLCRWCKGLLWDGEQFCSAECEETYGYEVMS